MFQSPSYRGCLCIRKYAFIVVLATAGFNPLPIGAVSASRWYRVECGDCLSFQSPSYRGCLCIRVDPLGELPAGLVSIPFLSGLSLHHLGQGGQEIRR